LLARHAAWAQRDRADPSPAHALHRFCAHRLDRIIDAS
jgi:hypothetical protein